MPRKQTMTRLALARRLQAIALSIATGKPIRVGRTMILVPERVVFEREVERSAGEMELDLEIMWSVDHTNSKAAPGRRRRVRKKSVSGKRG